MYVGKVDSHSGRHTRVAQRGLAGNAGQYDARALVGQSFDVLFIVITPARRLQLLATRQCMACTSGSPVVCRLVDVMFRE